MLNHTAYLYTGLEKAMKVKLLLKILMIIESLSSSLINLVYLSLAKAMGVSVNWHRENSMLEPRGADSRNGVVPTHTSASLFYYSTVISHCGSTCYQAFC